MPKSLEAGTISQIDASKRRPVILIELSLSSTLRYAISNQNIVFPEGGNTYTAKYITVGNVSQTLESQIQSISLQFDNTAKDMSSFAAYEDFEGKGLLIKRIFLDDIDSASDYVELFGGRMERPSQISKNFLTVTAVSGKTLSYRTLTGKYQRLCRHNFGDVYCNKNGLADLSTLVWSGTADSGDTTYLIDDSLTWADDYWNHGDIEVTYDGVVYHRKVADFVAADDKIIFDILLPFSVDNTCTYTVRKGCNQLWLTCKGTYIWGPNGDNSKNYGGFLHIPADDPQRKRVEGWTTTPVETTDISLMYDWWKHR